METIPVYLEHLGNLGDSKPQSLKSWEKIDGKQFFCMQWGVPEILLRSSEGGVIPILQYVGHHGNFKKQGFSHLNHGER